MAITTPMLTLTRAPALNFSTCICYVVVLMAVLMLSGEARLCLFDHNPVAVGPPKSPGVQSTPRWSVPAKQTFSEPFGRRAALRSLTSPLIILLPTVWFPSSAAIASDSSSSGQISLREEIASAASKLPGYGTPDLYFPSYFEGAWTTGCEVYFSNITGPVPELVSELAQSIGKPFEYTTVFYNYNNNIVCDRRGTQAGFLQCALHEPTITVSWAFNNPNVMTYEGAGSLVELKVTKRAAETPGPTFFSTREYLRVAELAGGGLISSNAQIFGMRVETKYKVAATADAGKPTSLDALERISVLSPSSSDGDGAGVVKMRLRMTRL